MEDILGILIFVIFIVLRAMGDRKKGMKKEPIPKKPQPFIEAQKPKPAPIPAAKTSLEKPRLERKPLEPTRLGANQKEPPRPEHKLGEGESSYDNLPYMEGAEQAVQTRDLPVSVEEPAAAAPAFFNGIEDLRKAVIWSEIIQKPRFRSRLY